MARALQGLRAAPAFLWRIPFRLCLLVTLLLHVIGEEYPFSNFPMYSNFHNDARVIWIGDNRLHETEQHLASKALPNPEPVGN